MILAVATALVSAACFAAGSALQHRVVGESSDSVGSTAGVFRELARRPSWLLGLALSAAAFALHALALDLGDLILVQPVIVSGVVFAVLIRAALDRTVPPARTIVFLVLTWSGLALFLAVRPPTQSAPPDLVRAAWSVVVGFVLAVLTVLASRRVARDRYRGLLFGAAAGVLFGLVAGLVKLVLSEASGGWAPVLTRWPLWALVIVGVTAVVVNQGAYRATRLSVTAPTLNIAQVVVALAFGVIVLGESVGSLPTTVAAEAGGLLLVAVGIWKLATQPDRSEQEA